MTEAMVRRAWPVWGRASKVHGFIDLPDPKSHRVKTMCGVNAVPDGELWSADDPRVCGLCRRIARVRGLS